MTSASIALAPGLLSRERIIARSGFNRWLVPPATLAIHLCNLLVTSVAEEHHMTDAELAVERRIADDTHQHFVQDLAALSEEVRHSWKVTLAWAAVWPTRLSTPPRLSARVNSRSDSRNRRTPLSPASNSMVTMPPKPFICRAAS